MNDLPLRLPPGSDLRRALEDAVRGTGHGSAFVVSGIGSLSNPRLRFAGAEAETPLSGAFEILSLAGTITPDGAHLHMSIADREGRVVGGHLGYGNEVRTTAEVLLVLLSGWALSRALDRGTGFKELVVRRVPVERSNGV